MVAWSARLTLVLVVFLVLLGTIVNVKTAAFRVTFFVTLALWQGALTVAIFTRQRRQSRSDCLGVGTISVLASVVYVLIRYRLSSTLVLAWIPAVVTAGLAGAWLASNASRKRASVSSEET
jgi:uncharacterized membrane protein HdeD (DUF308 family)